MGKKDSSNGVTGEKVTHPQAAEVAPQSAVASPPVVPEFPRVWIPLTRHRSGGWSIYQPTLHRPPPPAEHCICALPVESYDEQYVHISELQKRDERIASLRAWL